MKRKAVLCFMLLVLACIIPQVWLEAAIPPEQSVPQPTTIILVRHAEKVKDGSEDPVLTAKGHKRAKALATLLSLLEVHAIYSSHYNRTVDTARPLAEQKGLGTQTYEPKEQQNFLDKVLRKHAGKTVVIVGHSNTVPAAVNYLLKGEVVEEMSEGEYNKVFIVSISADGTVSYMPLVLEI